jgi:hypothetical protein
LTWRINRKAAHAGLRFKRRRLVTEPWFPSERPLLELPDLAAIRRAARDAQYEALPGPRLFAIARAHDVAFVWSPLGRVSGGLLERHRTFRQLWLAESQWETLKERLTAGETRQPNFARLLG